MALFGSKEKKQISKAVRPTVVRTQNVVKELQAIAKSYEVRVDTLDFNILEVQRYTRINDGTKETEWESINTDMDVGEISFKTTGSLNSGVDSDVSLHVSETDLGKDAIGTDMSVEVTEIDIDGNVGSNARVVALRATVAGQTHKTVCLKADDLDINIHKGKAYGKNIKVIRLEHGKIDGDFAIEAVAG